jgi:hypothetical protein
MNIDGVIGVDREVSKDVLKAVKGLIAKDVMKNVLFISKPTFKNSGQPAKFSQTRTGLWTRQLTGDLVLTK